MGHGEKPSTEYPMAGTASSWERGCRQLPLRALALASSRLGTVTHDGARSGEYLPVPSGTMTRFLTSWAPKSNPEVS
jgi:hypothetical protein